MTPLEDRIRPADPTAPPHLGKRVVSLRLGVLARRVALACLGTIVLLIGCDVVFNWIAVYDDSRIEKLFNIAREQNIPTWFASTQAVCTGIAAFLIAIVLRLRGMRRRELMPWMVFAAFFVFVGIDDAATIHERLGSVARDAWADAHAETAGGDKPALVSFGWQFFVAPFFAAMGLWMFVFLWRRFGSFGLRRWIFTGLALWALAVAFDFVEGIDGVFEGWALALGVENVYDVSHPWRLAEETMEMVGTCLILYGLLRYLAHAAGGFRVGLVGPPAWQTVGRSGRTRPPTPPRASTSRRSRASAPAESEVAHRHDDRARVDGELTCGGR